MPTAHNSLAATVHGSVIIQLIETTIAIVPVLVFTKLAGLDLGSIYLRRGRLGARFIIAIAGFGLFYGLSLRGAHRIIPTNGTVTPERKRLRHPCLELSPGGDLWASAHRGDLYAIRPRVHRSVRVPAGALHGVSDADDGLGDRSGHLPCRCGHPHLPGLPLLRRVDSGIGPGSWRQPRPTGVTVCAGPVGGRPLARLTGQVSGYLTRGQFGRMPKAASRSDDPGYIPLANSCQRLV